ncbi:MAG: DUF1801 domain-containing protein [Polyangiales bacterium]
MKEIRATIHRVDPEVVEEWKWKGTPVWSHDGMYVLADPFKDKVKITFFHGAQLADPKKLFNNGLDGNKWRAIDLRESDRLDPKAFEALLREAIAYNTSNSVAKSKGSTAMGRTKKTADAKAVETPAKTAAKETKASKTATTKTAAKETKAAKTKAATPKAAKKEPKMLSGGNPQIAKGEGDAPVQAYLDALPGWKADAGRAIDAAIVRAVPKVKKAVKWNSPFYGVEGQGWFLSFHAFKSYLKVGFFKGAALKPPPPVESKGDEVRYYHLNEGEALDEKRFVAWVKQAAAIPGWMA